MILKLQTIVSLIVLSAFILIALYIYLSYKSRKAAASIRYSYWGCIAVCITGIIGIALTKGIIPDGSLFVDLGFTKLSLFIGDEKSIWSAITSILSLVAIAFVATYLKHQENKTDKHLIYLETVARIKQERTDSKTQEDITPYNAEIVETDFEKLPFQERVKRVLENIYTVKYDFMEEVYDETAVPYCKIWIATYYEPQIYEPATAVIACVPSALMNKERADSIVKVFNKFCQGKNTPLGQLLIILESNDNFSKEVTDIFDSSVFESRIGSIRIKIKSIDELVYQLLPWEDYLRCLVNDFEKSRVQTFLEGTSNPTLIEAYQVPYGYFLEDFRITPEDKATEFEEHHITEQNKIENIDSLIDEWIKDKHKANIGLLASYGMGKTMFIRYTASRLAKNTLNQKTKRDWLIPLYIPLSGLSPNDAGIDALLESALARYSLRTSADAVKILLQLNRAILLFDAFDEMRAIETSEQRITQLRILQQGIQQGGRMLLTGRPNYFPERREVDEAMPMVGEQWRRFVRIGLAPLTKDQQKSMLDATLPKTQFPEIREYLDQALKNDLILQNLASRPVLLDMIRQTFQASKSIMYKSSTGERATVAKTAAEVVAGYVNLWLTRQQQKYEYGPTGTTSAHLLSREHYYMISKEVAKEMAIIGSPTIKASQIDSITKKVAVMQDDQDGRLYKTNINEETGQRSKTDFELNERLINAICQQVRSGALLVLHEGSFTFKFAHKSFQEFFLSKVFTDEIRLYLHSDRVPSWWSENDLLIMVENLATFLIWMFNRKVWVQKVRTNKDSTITSIFNSDEVKQHIYELNRLDAIPDLLRRYRSLKIKERAFFAVLILVSVQIVNSIFFEFNIYLSFMAHPVVVGGLLIAYATFIGRTRLKSIERELSGIIDLKKNRLMAFLPNDLRIRAAR